MAGGIRRLVWFYAIWALSVLAIATVGHVIRLVIVPWSMRFLVEGQRMTPDQLAVFERRWVLAFLQTRTMAPEAAVPALVLRAPTLYQSA